MNEQDQATWDALQRIAASGSDMNRPLMMDFFLAVPDQRSGQTLAARVSTFGFDISVDQDSESGDWACVCTKAIVPAFETVLSMERLLDELARDVGGYADGFGTFGNADAASPGH